MPVWPTRPQLVRHSLIAAVVVALALVVIGLTFAPGEVTEPGWENTAVGGAVYMALVVAALPALPILGSLAVGLSAIGVPDPLPVLLGAIPGLIAASFFWGWLSATIANWLQSHRAV